MGRARRVVLVAAAGAVAGLLLAGCPGPIPPPPPSPPSSTTGSAPPSPEPPSTTTSPPPAPDAASLTQRGVYGLEVTGSLFDVEEALGVELDYSPQTGDCSLATAEEVGLAVVMSGDFTTWAFVSEDPSLRTAEGIGVGSTVDDVLGTYGSAAIVLDDGVTPTGGPVVVVDDLARPVERWDDDSRLYGFDTDGAGTVTRVRSGLWPYVGYLDYCSDEASRPVATGWPLD